MVFLMYVISTFVITADYFRFAFYLPILDRLAVILSLVFFFVAVIVNKRKIKLNSKGFLPIILFYILTTLFISIVNEVPIKAYSYEIFKLLTFLSFFPIFSILNKWEKLKFLKVFCKVACVFIALNMLIMLFQILAGDAIVSIFGMPSEIYNDSQKSGRPMGLYGNLPALSISALCVYILIDIFKVYLGDKKTHKLILISTVILSTSKVAILILVSYWLIKCIGRKIIINILPIVSLIIIFLMYIENNDLFLNKLDQINAILMLGDSFLLADLSMVDWRFYCYILAFSIFLGNPFGLGLATWGDLSSSLNDNITHEYFKVYMSDSAYSHLLVEQGIFLILYMFIIFYPFIIYKVRVIFYWPMVATISFLTTMGFSDTTWPTVFSFCFSLTIYLYPFNVNVQDRAPESYLLVRDAKEPKFLE